MSARQSVRQIGTRRDHWADGPDSLPPPDEVAAEIVEDLEAALDKFRGVAAKLAALANN
jgi:type I restriction enzyme M protein